MSQVRDVYIYILMQDCSAGEDAKERILAEKALSTIQYLQVRVS